MNDKQLHDLKDIGELAAAGYWGKKLAEGDTDPVESKGRLGGATYVRNNAEYAAVATGQVVTVGHFLIVPLMHVYAVLLFVMEWGAFSIHGAAGLPVSVLVFLVWCYVFVWRLGIKLITKRGPSIAPADGYRGPANVGNTTYTGRTLAKSDPRPGDKFASQKDDWLDDFLNGTGPWLG